MERNEFFSSSTTSTTTTTNNNNNNNNNNFLESPKKKIKNRDKDKNQRRFSDDQIKLLETMFESETRLEPKKKLEVARELGLQPRQVAIWFQNRRARWKSKQIEQDFRALRAEYETLASKFESLNEEKKSLISQLQTLNDVLRNAHDENRKDGVSTSKTSDPKCEFANLSLEDGFKEDKRVLDRTINNFDELSQQGDDELVVNTNYQQLDTSLASLENWYRHDLGGILDQSRGFSQWFNFWC